jgi:hypothetical protein
MANEVEPEFQWIHGLLKELWAEAEKDIRRRLDPGMEDVMRRVTQPPDMPPEEPRFAGDGPHD